MDMDNDVYVFTIPLCTEPTEAFKSFIENLGEPPALTVAMFDVTTLTLRFMNCSNEVTEIMSVKVGSDNIVIRERISKSVSKLNFALSLNCNVSITLKSVKNDIKTYIVVTAIIDERIENIFNLIDNSSWSKNL